MSTHSGTYDPNDVNVTIDGKPIEQATGEYVEVSRAVDRTAEAFERLHKTMKRMHKPRRRRSRQCRGTRARNYTRAVMRAANGSPFTSDTSSVVADGLKTGALAAARRLSDSQRSATRLP